MPEVSDHLVKSLMRLVRQSTTVPNTSNTSAFTADTSDIGRPPPFLVVIPGRAKCEPGISRFSGAQLRTVVRCFASPRNDVVTNLVEVEFIQLPMLRLDVAHRAGDRAHHHRFGLDHVP